MKFTKKLSPIAIAIALSGGFILTGCNDQQAGDTSQQSQIASVNVDVFKVAPLSYTVKTTLPGRVIASQIAEIRPQVSGIILKREFEESSNVTAGQSLYQIDPAIYQATYASTLASVESAKASASLSHLTLQRYAGLLKTKSISQQDYDKASADAKQTDAAVMVAEAAANTAKVNLDYTKVYSPIDGYIGKSSVTEGALVAAGQATPLAIVQQLDPIYVDMTQASIKFEQNEKDREALFLPSDKMPVNIILSDGTPYSHTGYVKFSDKTVNETTGTVTIRAEFPNPDKQLLPGMFIKPQLIVGTIENALLVPQQGVTSNAKGQYTAKVIGADGLVQDRTDLKVYGGINNYWIVTQGLEAGEQIILTNLLTLSQMAPGTPVKANVVSTKTLTQPEVDDIINSNTK